MALGFEGVTLLVFEDVRVLGLGLEFREWDFQQSSHSGVVWKLEFPLPFLKLMLTVKLGLVSILLWRSGSGVSGYWFRLTA